MAEPYAPGSKEWWLVRQVANGDERRSWYELTDEDRAALVAPAALAWLIEWPADRQMPVRYWHPTEGHVIDPNHAVRFCRREDAEAMMKRDHLFGGARAVEHMWVAAPNEEPTHAR